MRRIARLILGLGGVWPVFRSSGNAGSVAVRQSTRSARIFPVPFGRIVLTGGGSVFGEHRIHRYISDADHNYFGYDLLLGLDESEEAYHLAFEPLSIEPEQFLPPQLRARYRSGEQIALEQLPSPQVLRLGHALRFSVATADGKYEVVERLEFSKP